MNNSNMINPANYYNPFAKYNYVSKTRGVYIPKSTEPLIQLNNDETVKSTSIYSENYDAEADVMASLNENNSHTQAKGVLGFFNKFFNN